MLDLMVESAVRGRAEHGGTGVEILEFGGADVAAGAGIRRRGGDVAGEAAKGVV